MTNQQNFSVDAPPLKVVIKKELSTLEDVSPSLWFCVVDADQPAGNVLHVPHYARVHH